MCLAFTGAAVFGGFRLIDSPTCQVFGELVSRVETTRPVVALTFDDGPTDEGVEAILPVLAESRVHATFFVTGRALETRIDLGRRLVTAGHELGNHSYSHSRMIFIAPSTVASEVERTDTLIRDAGYTGPIRFRPPYGKKLVELPWYLRQTGRVSVTWDVAPDSDPTLAADADKMATEVVRRVRPGSIVLMHVMHPTGEASRRAVPAIVDGLERRGFDFVTVSELLAIRERP